MKKKKVRYPKWKKQQVDYWYQLVKRDMKIQSKYNKTLGQQ